MFVVLEKVVGKVIPTNVVVLQKGRSLLFMSPHPRATLWVELWI